MATSICGVAPELKDKFKEFRFRKTKTLGAFIMKVNKAKMLIEVEEEWEDTTIEEIASEIPPQQPRYVGISYPFHHADGRISYPLIFVFISPSGCSPELQVLYAGSKQFLQIEAGFTKQFEYRNLEDFTDESIQENLKRV